MNNIIKIANYLENKYGALTDQYIYHVKSPDFKGRTIYSLSGLEDAMPDLYKKEYKKYKGREAHINTKIDILDCTWKDCINFSTVNPVLIFELEELLGIPAFDEDDKIEIFKINIKALQDYEFCYYDEVNPKSKKSYKKVSVKSYRELDSVPHLTAKYFAECKKKNEHPLIFGHVPHILVKGNFKLKDYEVIKFKPKVKGKNKRPL